MTRGLAVAVVTLASLALGTPARAEQRFVTTDGSASSTCAEAAPCTIQRAFELITAAGGDDIVIAPGDYMIGGSSLDASGERSGNLSIHGIRGLPRPHLIGSGHSVLIVGRAHVNHLRISGTFGALQVGAGGTYDDLVLTAGGAGFVLTVDDHRRRDRGRAHQQHGCARFRQRARDPCRSGGRRASQRHRDHRRIGGPCVRPRGRPCVAELADRDVA